MNSGFQRIESLEDYVNLRTLWLDHNYFSSLHGLLHLKQLKCLFIQNNALSSLEGVEFLEQLVILDVSHNQLTNTNHIGISAICISRNEFRSLILC